MRSFVRRLASLVLLSASLATSGQSTAPKPASAHPLSQLAEAEAAIVQLDWKTAEAKLALWLAANPTDARALFDAGYVADAENRMEDAAAFYRKAVAANPQSFEAHIELGLLLARMDKEAEARPELEAATKLDPGVAGVAAKAKAWRALAQIDRASDPAKASSDLLEALKHTPETTADTLLAAELADQAGQPVEAENGYRRVLARDANSAAANAGLAHLLIARKDYAAAETLLRTALEHSPGDTALTAQLATVLAAQDKAEALPLLEKLHTDHPADQAITRMLAEVLDEAAEAAEADKLWLLLLAAKPDDPQLLVAHGHDLTRQKNFAAAFAVFDKATQLDPANADAWSGLAFAASRTAHPDVTLHALAMRAKYLPELPATYFLWATAYDTLREKEQAAAYYHRFLDSSKGQFPDKEWQAKQRLLVVEKK